MSSVSLLPKNRCGALGATPKLVWGCGPGGTRSVGLGGTRSVGSGGGHLGIALAWGTQWNVSLQRTRPERPGQGCPGYIRKHPQTSLGVAPMYGELAGYKNRG
jgi:hypothetical protein